MEHSLGFSTLLKKKNVYRLNWNWDKIYDGFFVNYSKVNKILKEKKLKINK